MSNKKINELLRINNSNCKIDDIHWKTQDSTSTSVLFYKVSNEINAAEVFKQRIKTAHFSWLVINKNLPDLPMNSVVINDTEWPHLQAEILNELYPLPKMKLIGITGTNGKTTTTDLVLQLGSLNGKKGLSIGSLGVRENHKTLVDFGLTSPGLIDLRKFLHNYGKDKDFCVFEVSSHALDQERIFGLKLDAGAWLSFSQDHLDYHRDMENYFNSKMKIFNYLKDEAKFFVPSEQTELAKKISNKNKTVAIPKIVSGDLPIFFQTQFNKNNLEVAVALVENTLRINVSPDWHLLQPPDGRFYIKKYKSNFIVVDFAHTPDALENICKGISSAFPNYKLKILFGCGGDRDRTKRPLMGEVSQKWAKKVYLTSDNPRSEDPEQIIEDIAKGINKDIYLKIVDRKEAVRFAFSELVDSEILLLAGKGNENYILSKGIKTPYSDIEEVEKFIGM